MSDKAEAYERAISRAEAVFANNKSRMRVLRILREYLAEELNNDIARFNANTAELVGYFKNSNKEASIRAAIKNAEGQ